MYGKMEIVKRSIGFTGNGGLVAAENAVAVLI
jgi:hypothetical protein